MKVGLGHRGAVDLRLHHDPHHGGSLLSGTPSQRALADLHPESTIQVLQRNIAVATKRGNSQLP
jgi:hypothetical protein